MIEVAEAWVWAIVATGGLLALLSLILAIALGFMLDGPASFSAEPDNIVEQRQGQ